MDLQMDQLNELSSWLSEMEARIENFDKKVENFETLDNVRRLVKSSAREIVTLPAWHNIV